MGVLGEKFLTSLSISEYLITVEDGSRVLLGKLAGHYGNDQNQG